MRGPKSNLNRTNSALNLREKTSYNTRCQHSHMQKAYFSSSFVQSHSQLLLELQHQITELLPLRNSFPNLLFYYEQLKSNYEDLLNQMHETHYMKSFVGLKGKEVEELSTKLREKEVEYQELSDYFNLHLIEKISKTKEENKIYCQKLTTIQQNHQKLKEQRKTIMVDNDVLKTQYEKILKESALIEHLCAKEQSQVKDLKLQVSNFTQTQKNSQLCLQQLKQQQVSKLELQSQLLSDVLQKRKILKEFTQKENQLNIQADLTQKLKKQLIFHQNSSKQKTIQVQTLRTIKIEEYETNLLDTKFLEEQICRIEKENNLHKQLLTEINQKEIPEVNSQLDLLKEENTKSQQFLSYLFKYERQLKQTSNLMFQQLQQCCKQDYQKMLKPNSNLLNATIHTPLSIKKPVQGSYLYELDNKIENRKQRNILSKRDLSNFIDE